MDAASSSLTRREREVARLVAEGLTSKEIAQRLFISERTAEGHVDQIRSKLGFRSRAQIAAWIASDGLQPVSSPKPAVATQTVPARAPSSRLIPRARWIWLAGGCILMLALGVFANAVFEPSRSGGPAKGPIIETFIGTGVASVSADNDLPLSTNLIAPVGVAVTTAGIVYFTDGYRIRFVGADGRVQTIAGDGLPGFAGDNGPAVQAEIQISGDHVGMVADSKGDLFFSDPGNNRVREVKAGGEIVTVAGGDGSLSQPRGLALDSLGDLFIADTGANRVVKLASDGARSIVAGDGALGWAGDGGIATQAELSAPEGLAIDSQGDLLIADSGNERIRKVKDGIITTLAGNGNSGFSGDSGPAIRAEMQLPLGLAVDARGNVYIADAADGRVRKVDRAGVITTVAGDGVAGFSGDSHSATAATLNLPVAVAVSPAGDLYIADMANNRVRVVHLGRT